MNEELRKKIITDIHKTGFGADMQAVPELAALAREIEAAFPRDEATPRLSGIIAAKVARVAGGGTRRRQKRA